MLVEHSFVTTIDGEQALERAGEFLSSVGYQLVSSTPGKEILYRRGNEAIRHLTNFNDLPQQTHVSFDRGRLDIASSVHEFKKVDPLHRKLMMAVVNGLESYIVHAITLDQARSEFDIVKGQINHLHRSRKRRNATMWGCLVFFLLAVAGFVYFAVSQI